MDKLVEIINGVLEGEKITEHESMLYGRSFSVIDLERVRQKIQVVRDGLKKLEVIKAYSCEEFVNEPPGGV